MNLLEIILIIIGVIIIAISCKLVDRHSNTTKQVPGSSFSLESSLTEMEKKELMEKLKNMLSDLSEESIVRTDDIMSKISNEKIMSLNEFSDQILEKIKRNHEEVVFLYNMLNDKEKELKAAIKEIDTSKKKLQNIVETKAEETVQQASKRTTTQAAGKKPADGNPLGKPAATVKKEARSVVEPKLESAVTGCMSANSNAQILELYSQGKTLIEISKLLGLGQGEVKLVIELFKGKK